MRVLTLVDALRLGGAETLIAQLARVSSAADFQIEVLSMLGPSDEHSKLAPLLSRAGVEPGYLGVHRTLDVPAFGRLVRKIKASKADVVHAHLEMAMTMGLPAAAMAGVPAVATFHHVHRPLTGRAAARERLAVEVATRSSAAIFVSQASRKSFAERYRADRPVPDSWKVIHNGIDLEQFTPDTTDGCAVRLPADLGLGDSRVVTVLAALRDFKGIKHAVDAWATIEAQQPDVRLLLVGSGTEEAALRSQVRALGLAERVVFAGVRNDIPEILRASEVVLLPSIYGENLPTVLMEAGGCGRPVVASDVGGIRDIVSDEETGLLVPPGGAGGIAVALSRLLDNPGLGNQLGVAGRRRMEERFDARNWAVSLRSVYEAAIDDKLHAGRAA